MRYIRSETVQRSGDLQIEHPRINFLHITVSEIGPKQDFKAQGHYGKVKVHIKVTP